MNDISKLNLGSDVDYNIKDAYMRSLVPSNADPTTNKLATMSDVSGGGGNVDAYNVSYLYTNVGTALDILLEDITYTITVNTTESSLIGEDVTITYGSDTQTATFSSLGIAQFKIIKYTGLVSISSTDGEDTATGSVIIVSGTQSYSTSLSFKHIYGVSWDGSSSPAMTRTGGAVGFSDPSPAVNNGSGSSPFDSIAPWSGMEIVDDTTGGKLVSIPKYYYKWTKTGDVMTLDISETEEDGFLVSPAHADRGDGKGERDVVYVGRYHSASSTYKSTTGVTPQVDVTRATARSGIHNLGNAYWQYDFAMFWTIMMLYIVEYANWNSQATIGYGCAPDGSTSAVRNMGYTDNMQYHTGTTAANRTTYGGTQYRYIEGLWDNCFDWCDGIYFSGINVYCIKNPSNFSDTSNGTKVGTRPTSGGYISAWNVPSVSGYEYALYPSAVSGSDSTYICDYCSYNSSGVVLRVGGSYGQYQDRGAFCLLGVDAASSQNAGTGCRLMKLPN